MQHVFFALLLPCDAVERRTVGSGQPVTEDGGLAWQRLAALVPVLAPVSDNLLSWPPGLGKANDGHNIARRGTRAAAPQSGARHGMEALRGMTTARRSRAGGHNREAATAEASGEFIS